MKSRSWTCIHQLLDLEYRTSMATNLMFRLIKVSGQTSVFLMFKTNTFSNNYFKFNLDLIWVYQCAKIMGIQMPHK